MSNLQTLKFFVTPDHDCSYIERATAKTLFVDPQAPLDKPTYSQLTQYGFRRSGTHVYRPHCDGCAACISARIPVDRFKRSKSQRRIWNKNKDILVETVEPRVDAEIYDLYARYINARHDDGDMYPPSQEQFVNFLVESNQNTQFHLYRDMDGELLAVAVTDQLVDGLSAVYSFFSPNHDQRSLGVFSVLWQLEYLKQINLPYNYLGYWVKNCKKMAYKTQYLPIEILLDDVWVDATDDMIK
jgi:arginine-tRNA-protein transferase